MKSVSSFAVTYISELKMNAVPRAQLIFQMLTLLQKYLYRYSQYSKTWCSNCLALIAQMVRAFCMNPKVGGSSPLRPRYFLSKKFDTFTMAVWPVGCFGWKPPLVTPGHLTSDLPTLYMVRKQKCSTPLPTDMLWYDWNSFTKPFRA